MKLKGWDSSTCRACHKNTKPPGASAKAAHKKMETEGATCIDCHQKHGGTERRQFRTSWAGEVACVKCHNEKTGPFVFEHASFRLGGCQSCHERTKRSMLGLMLRIILGCILVIFATLGFTMASIPAMPLERLLSAAYS